VLVLAFRFSEIAFARGWASLVFDGRRYSRPEGKSIAADHNALGSPQVGVGAPLASEGALRPLASGSLIPLNAKTALQRRCGSRTAWGTALNGQVLVQLGEDQGSAHFWVSRWESVKSLTYPSVARFSAT